MFVGERDLGSVGLSDLDGVGAWTRPEGVVPVPAGLDAITPGPELLTVLSTVDRSRISGFDQVVVLQAWHRLLSHVQAQFAASLHAVATAVADVCDRSADPGHEFDLATAEISTALTWTRRAAHTQLANATDLTGQPALWEALNQGTIDLPKTRVISDHTIHLPPQQAEQATTTILHTAPQLTTGQLRARIARLCHSLHPDLAATQYQHSVTGRRIGIDRDPEGTATLAGYQLPADTASQALARINQIAQTINHANDPRTLDQIRADIYLDLLTGNHNYDQNIPAGTRKPLVDIRIDLTTLIGLDNQPGEINGYGPVIADITRQLANQHGTNWQIAITNPTGHILDLITTRRRPTSKQKQWVQTLDPTCIFPTCRQPSTQTDIDHTQPWNQTQQTNTQQLAPLCRHHHTLRHHGWQYQNPQPGQHTWTSPLGHTHTTPPPPANPPPPPQPHPP